MILFLFLYISGKENRLSPQLAFLRYGGYYKSALFGSGGHGQIYPNLKMS